MFATPKVTELQIGRVPNDGDTFCDVYQFMDDRVMLGQDPIPGTVSTPASASVPAT